MGKPAKIYPESTAEELDSRLKRLSENPKGLQVKDLVFRMRPKIEAAQAVGYSLEDIVKEFEAVGVSLTLNTLKQYLREVRALPDPPPSPEPATPKRPAAIGKKAETTPSPSSPEVSSPAQPSASAIATRDEAQDENRTSKHRLTNTNEDGFQEMLSNDEL